MLLLPSSFSAHPDAPLVAYRDGPCHCAFRNKTRRIFCHARPKYFPDNNLNIEDFPIVSSKDADLSTAPLVRALQSSAKQNVSRFHFPGHNQGRAAPSSLLDVAGTKMFLHDLPELPDLDNLFSPRSVIRDAQDRAAELFGSSKTWFLVGGSTCGVQASIMATCSPNDILILSRNSHFSGISGMVLSGAVPKYVMPEYNSVWDVAGGMTPDQVEKAIHELERYRKHASAILITSPTYHGICSDVASIVEICHARGIAVIVDEAHGAHFRFHEHFPETALDQGVDLSVQSTHKVLSSLTQSSMLHMAGELIDVNRVNRCLQMLQSSSPSYLLLASLDAARAELSQNAKLFDEPLSLSANCKRQLAAMPGLSILDCSNFVAGYPAIDPLRITVGTMGLSIPGYASDEILFRKYGIIPELVGARSLTLAITPGTRRQDVEKLVVGLKHLSDNYFEASAAERVMMDEVAFDASSFGTMELSPREAFFAEKRRVRIEDSIGEICGEMICPYPPGIPMLFPGEVITTHVLSRLLLARSMGAEISGATDPSISSVLVCAPKI